MSLENDPLLESVPTRSGFKVLGTTILLAEVGRGGFGAVYRAHDAKFDLEVGVKCLLPPDSQWREQSIRRFVREARLAVQLNHQNLVRVFDVGRSGGIEYLVMEFVAGETARERVARKGPLRVDESLSIALGVARGLAAAHRAGIVHRDVKPDNVLVSSEGEVKLADLGLGKALGDLAEATVTSADLAMGTPRYMPPEQWESLSAVGTQGDVWAVGATLYFLLAGHDALQGSPTEILHQVSQDEFPDVAAVRDDVPEGIRELIAHCTRREPAARPRDGAELAARLETALQQLGITPRVAPDAEAGAGSRRTVMVTPPPRHLVRELRVQVGIEDSAAAAVPPRRRRAVLVAAAVVVGLALAAFAWFGRGDSEDTNEAGSTASSGTPQAGGMPSVKGAPDLKIGVLPNRGDEALDPLPPLLEILRSYEGFTRKQANAQGPAEFVHDQTGLVFVQIPAGTFSMGSPATDTSRYSDEGPVHSVTLDSFLIARRELPQGVWNRFMPEEASSPAEGDLPARGLTWQQAREFCRRTGLAMPTEAQWEYTARLGEAGLDLAPLDERAWSAANSGSRVHPVGTRAPDALGIQDLRGNVAEWCRDVYVPYTATVTTGVGQRVSVQSLLLDAGSQRRVLRGGSYLSNPVGLGLARRSSCLEEETRPEIGFRPVWVPPTR